MLRHLLLFCFLTLSLSEILFAAPGKVTLAWKALLRLKSFRNSSDFNIGRDKKI